MGVPKAPGIKPVKGLFFKILREKVRDEKGVEEKKSEKNQKKKKNCTTLTDGLLETQELGTGKKASNKNKAKEELTIELRFQCFQIH